MNWAERKQWLAQWVPFSIRTLGYGVVSLTLGPLSRGSASTWAARKWSQSSARGLRLEITVTGLDNVPGQGSFIYTSNHESLLDTLVLGATLPGDFKWAAKRQLMKVPILGWHLRLAGHVPVDRGVGKDAAIAVTHAFESVLRKGKPLLVFPEGTRTADGHMRPFKNGAFRAAVKVGAPIVPIALTGTFKLMSREAADTGAIDDGMRPVSVEIGEPLRPNTELDENAAISDLRDRTRAAIAQMLGREVEVH